MNRGQLSYKNQNQLQTIYENLRTLRQARGWPIDELSNLSGIHVKILADIEEGKDFYIQHLFALCRVYRVTPREMFTPMGFDPGRPQSLT